MILPITEKEHANKKVVGYFEITSVWDLKDVLDYEMKKSSGCRFNVPVKNDFYEEECGMLMENENSTNQMPNIIVEELPNMVQTDDR